MQHPSFFVRFFMPNTAKQYLEQMEEEERKREGIRIRREEVEKKNEEWKKKMEEQEKQKRELYAKYDAEKEERKREGMEIYSMCLEEVEEQQLRKIKSQERQRAEMLVQFASRLQIILDIETEINICKQQTSDFRRGIGLLFANYGESMQNAQNATSYEDYKKYKAQASEIKNTAHNLAVAPRNKQHRLLHELFSEEEKVIVNDKLGELRWLNSKK